VIGLLLERVGPYFILSVLIIGSGWLAGNWIKEKGRAELRPQIERLEATLAAERADRARAERAAAAYQSEMEDLRNRAVNRAVNRTPVRLCVAPKAVPSQQPAQGVDGATTTAGVDVGPARGDLEAGPDIGEALYALAAACDAENAKLRALQGWIKDGG
jgi:hypothetical protein